MLIHNELGGLIQSVDCGLQIELDWIVDQWNYGFLIAGSRKDVQCVGGSDIKLRLWISWEPNGF